MSTTPDTLEAKNVAGQSHTLSDFVSHRIGDGLIALSFANLCFSCAWFTTLRDVEHGYFNKIPVNAASLLALLVNLAWLSSAVFFILRAHRRNKGNWIEFGSGLVLWGLLIIPVEFCRIYLFKMPLFRFVPLFTGPLGIFCGLLCLGVIMWKPRMVFRLPIVIASLLSPLAIFNVAKIGLLLVGAHHLTARLEAPSLPRPIPVQEGRPRVIWVIFDEMDERLSFDQRPAKVKLPEFDRLCKESVMATNAFPPADATLLSMPSLIVGHRVVNAVPTNSSDLELSLQGSAEPVSWSQQPSVFDAAHELGYNTALVGWYHPYGRVLWRGLNACTWSPLPSFEPTRSQSFSSALELQIGAMAGGFHHRRRSVELCQNALNASVQLMTNGTYGLALLHFNIPHQPGIFDVKTGRLTPRGLPRTVGYMNNLALADRYLHVLRSVLEASSLASTTWLLVSADHSWRESRLYDSQRDMRIPFILKPPTAGQGMQLATRINTVITHDLIIAILSRQITDQKSATDWLEAHKTSMQTEESSLPD